MGEAATGDETVALATSLQRNEILMDIKLPGLNGITATREILAANPQIRILILRMFADEDWVFAAMRAAARGYLLKAASHEELLRTIRDVSNAKVIFRDD